MNLHRMRLLWRAVRQRRDYEAGLDAELAFHVEARASDLVAQGLAPEAATRQARIELGMAGLHRDGARQAIGLSLLDGAWRDLRLAARGLLRHRGYSITALLVLTIALGANALLFTLYSSYALRSPPVAQLARWVTLEATSTQGQRLANWTLEEADALVARPTQGLAAAYLLREARLTVGAEVTRRASGESVSDNYFDVLGVRAARGRTFDAAGGDHRPVVLSALGQQRLLPASADPVGQRITLAGEAFTVIGVMPPEFTGTLPLSALYWVRDGDYRDLQPGFRTEGAVAEVSGLLEEGASAASASQALTAWAVRQRSDTREDWMKIASAEATPRRGYLPARDVRDLQLAALPVGLAFVLVLLVAAANLANLVLARFAARQRELAVRIASGAPRARLVAQLMTECLLLAGIATLLAAGMAMALLQPVQSGLYALMDDAGFDLIPIAFEWRALGYTAGLALLASLAFGLLPALLATRPWKGGGARLDLASRQGTPSLRLRSGLMVAQLAASVVLLVLAGLVIANAQGINRVQLGFDPLHTIAVHAWPPTPELARELEALPQVRQVAGASRVPLTGDAHRVSARIGERSETLLLRAVDPPYFSVFGLERLHGRILQRGDAGARVAVVSRRTAERLWPDGQPLGRVIELPPQDALGALPGGRFEVVGVVEDTVSNWFVDGVDASAVYLPAAIGSPAIGSLVVQVQDASHATREAVMQACVRAASERNCELMPMTLAVKMQRLPFLAASTVSAALGWIALAISCIGLYGLMSYAVVQRRREIGVRLALGARSGRIVRELLRGAGRQVAIGLLLGLPLAFAASRVVAALTDRLQTFDLLAFTAVPLALAAIALLAAWLPARRSAGIAPTEALRED